MKSGFVRTLSSLALASTLGWTAQAATLEATYLFDGTLLAEESGAPALTAVDPLGASNFGTTQVFGETRIVYNFGGTASEQGGLSLSTASLINRTSYSIEMVFDFTGTSGFRRLVDVRDRSTDNGLYVDPDDRLNVWTGSSNAGGTVSDTGFQHVALTAQGNRVRGYVNGVQGISFNTNTLHLSNADTLNFFLDNTVGNGQGEYSGGAIAFMRLYSGALTAIEVASLAAAPLPAQSPAPVPLPSSVLLLGTSVIGSFLLRRRAG